MCRELKGAGRMMTQAYGVLHVIVRVYCKLASRYHLLRRG